MTAALGRLYPDASEALQLAARAQHIRRWTVPRASYPMDRAGYLRWRKDLKRKHAEWAGDILADCGYAEDEIARVGSLIRKENLKRDAEAQALEDVASIVFLEHYAADFARQARGGQGRRHPRQDAGQDVRARARGGARRLDLPPAVACS